MERVVIDSSVLIKWFVPEVGSDLADHVLERYRDRTLSLLAPDLLFAKIGNIVWKKCRSGSLAPEDGQAIVDALDMIRVEVTPAADLLRSAYSLATKHERTVYDSLYLALSLREQAPFLTADEKLVHAVRNDLPNVMLLGEWAA